MSRVLLSAAKWATLTSLLLLAPACAHHSKAFHPERLDSEKGWLVVRDVPVVRQTTPTNCGAASMSMVLGYWGTPVSLEEMASELPATTGDGTFRAGELRDFARARGLNAFVIAGDMKDIRQQLERKRPLLVGIVQRTGLNKGIAHYVVIVGYDAGRDLVVMLDPARGWRENSVDGFMKEWEGSGRLALVAFP
jgi:ABC-type bacteriocin/lantibiotic exporter with double-glycine peptidase domain